MNKKITKAKNVCTNIIYCSSISSIVTPASFSILSDQISTLFICSSVSSSLCDPTIPRLRNCNVLLLLLFNSLMPSNSACAAFPVDSESLKKKVKILLIISNSLTYSSYFQRTNGQLLASKCLHLEQFC